MRFLEFEKCEVEHLQINSGLGVWGVEPQSYRKSKKRKADPGKELGTGFLLANLILFSLDAPCPKHTFSVAVWAFRNSLES